MSSHAAADDVYIRGGARTPMANYVGALEGFSAIELDAQGIAARVETVQ